MLAVIVSLIQSCMDYNQLNTQADIEKWIKFLVTTEKPSSSRNS